LAHGGCHLGFDFLADKILISLLAASAELRLLEHETQPIRSQLQTFALSWITG
jgi:hypothetical protein